LFNQFWQNRNLVDGFGDVLNNVVVELHDRIYLLNELAELPSEFFRLFRGDTHALQPCCCCIGFELI